MKTECDYLNGWIKKTVTYAKISPKSGEPQRFSWGMQTKQNKKYVLSFLVLRSEICLYSWCSDLVLRTVSAFEAHLMIFIWTTLDNSQQVYNCVCVCVWGTGSKQGSEEKENLSPPDGKSRNGTELPLSKEMEAKQLQHKLRQTEIEVSWKVLLKARLHIINRNLVSADNNLEVNILMVLMRHENKNDH